MKVTMDNLRDKMKEIRDILDQTEVLMKGDRLCPTCNREILESDNIAFVKEYGHCIMCDSVQFDVDRELYDEVNREEIE